MGEGGGMPKSRRFSVKTRKQREISILNSGVFMNTHLKDKNRNIENP